MDFSYTSRKIKQAVLKSNNVLLVTHQNPDYDAVGSITAFSQWLESLDKKHDFYCQENVLEKKFDFLISTNVLKTEPEILSNNIYDLIVVLDCGDYKRSAINEIVVTSTLKPVIINIDHHNTNDYFADFNIVDIQAASTTEILYKFFKYIEVDLSSHMSTALLSGIIDDTYSFTNSNTKHESLDTASRLVISGARFPLVNDSISKNKSVDMLRVWGKVLYRLQRNEKYNIAVTVITQQDLAECESTAEVTEGIANFLNNLSDVEVALVLKEEDGLIKGSFRTNSDLIDVSALAKMLGGGGHQKAAGFRVKGRLIENSTGGWQVV